MWTSSVLPMPRQGSNRRRFSGAAAHRCGTRTLPERSFLWNTLRMPDALAVLTLPRSIEGI
jgi:hypothetical protein